VVLHSQSGTSTYAAHLLQGILGIPQVREGIESAVKDGNWRDMDGDESEAVSELFSGFRVLGWEFEWVCFVPTMRV
jgi:hypothetical protein